MAITFPAGTAKYPRESSLREENQRGSIWQKARALCIRHKGGPRPGRGTNRWRGLIPSPSLFIPRSEDRSTDGGSGDGTDTRNREIRIFLLDDEFSLSNQLLSPPPSPPPLLILSLSLGQTFVQQRFSFPLRSLPSPVKSVA